MQPGIAQALRQRFHRGVIVPVVAEENVEVVHRSSPTARMRAAPAEAAYAIGLFM